MRVNDICAECLYDKQMHLSDDRRYLEEVRRIIEERREEDTAPYLVYLFDKEYVRLFGKTAPYAAIKKTSMIWSSPWRASCVTRLNPLMTRWDKPCYMPGLETISTSVR